MHEPSFECGQLRGPRVKMVNWRLRIATAAALSPVPALDASQAFGRLQVSRETHSVVNCTAAATALSLLPAVSEKLRANVGLQLAIHIVRIRDAQAKRAEAKPKVSPGPK